jgi:hypothetical protein
MLDNALPNLNAKCNGFNADVTRLITPDNGRMIYIWIKPPAHALLMNGYNNITLTFSEASIPEINDPRGLCILHSFAMMFNLNIIQNESNSTMNIDYATTSELCIGGDQSHYIHHNWSKLDNEIAEIPAIIELWIDSIENNKNDAWSAT